MRLNDQPGSYTCWVGELPPYLAFACKKKDLDACLSGLGGPPPFETVKMMRAGGPAWGARRLKIATAAHVAPKGSERRVGLDLGVRRSLSIYTVPEEEARSVRAQLRVHGLGRLCDWLRECSRRSAFWQAYDHWADLLYDRRTRSLVFQERVESLMGPKRVKPV